METTIGKRIAENRKRLGMTQDQLAEQLGVTAQAVSKWENDQSCPDISTLPRLAEIFGISTDTLLGHETHQTVHLSEVVDEESEETDGIHINNEGWSFRWDGGRRGPVFFALWVLLCGGLLLAGNFLHWEVGFWDILWPSGLLMLGMSGLRSRFSFFNLGCILFGGYFLADNLNLLPFEFGKELLLPVFLVLLGLSLLFDALRKPKKPRFHISRNGVDLCDKGKTESHFTTDERSFDCSLSFGEANRYIQLPLLECGEISCSFGELTVDLSGCDAVSDDCEIEAACSFGQLILLVPKRFRVDPDTRTAFGVLDFQGQPDADPLGIIHLDGRVSFGNIEIRYI